MGTYGECEILLLLNKLYCYIISTTLAASMVSLPHSLFQEGQLSYLISWAIYFHDSC